MYTRWYRNLGKPFFTSLFCFRYARTGVVASDPIVPFRETVVPPPSVDNVNEAIEGENMDSREQQVGPTVFNII